MGDNTPKVKRKWKQGSFNCNNAEFGDPYPGTGKMCYCRESSSGTAKEKVADEGGSATCNGAVISERRATEPGVTSGQTRTAKGTREWRGSGSVAASTATMLNSGILTQALARCAIAAEGHEPTTALVGLCLGRHTRHMPTTCFS